MISREKRLRVVAVLLRGQLIGVAPRQEVLKPVEEALLEGVKHLKYNRINKYVLPVSDTWLSCKIKNMIFKL